MCANYTPPLPRALRELLLKELTFDYPSEAFPGYDAPIVVADAHGELLPVRASFGLVPHWAKDANFAKRTYNARSETVAEKASYRDAWKHRRFCLVPVQRIFEPNYESGHAVRWSIHRADQAIFMLAGIWESKTAEDGRPQRSFSMLTIAAAEHPLMQRFHGPEDEKRSVVVLPAAHWNDWLHAADTAEARELLQPFNAADFTAEAAPLIKKPSGKKTIAAPKRKAVQMELLMDSGSAEAPQD